MDISDFYCTVCKVQMNSQFMWDSHINGKKHIKNVNKDSAGESFETQPKAVVEDIESDVYDEDKTAKIEETLKDVSEPVIGLDYVIELQYPDTDIHPSYSCTLCKCTIGVMAIVEHIKSTKHRMNFTEQKDPNGFKILERMQTSGVPLDGLAEVRAASLEQQYGRGKVKVKTEKSKFGSISGMRKRPQGSNNNMNDDFIPHPHMRVNTGYSNYRIDLSAAQKQFLAQIPYFETTTKLQMLEQLTSLDISNDDEAKDAISLVNCMANLLHRYKTLVYHLDNPRRPQRDMDAASTSRSAGMGMPPMNSGMGMPLMNQGMGMPPRNQGMGMPLRNQGMGMPPRNQGMGMPQRNQGMGMPPRNQGMGMPLRNQGMGMPPRNQGMGMPLRNQGMEMPLRNQGMEMPPMNQGMGMPPMNQGMGMPSADGGMAMPERDPGMGGARNNRQGYNELVGYPQLRGAYSGASNYNYRPPFGNRGSYM